MTYIKGATEIYESRIWAIHTPYHKVLFCQPNFILPLQPPTQCNRIASGNYWRSACQARTIKHNFASFNHWPLSASNQELNLFAYQRGSFQITNGVTKYCVFESIQFCHKLWADTWIHLHICLTVINLRRVCNPGVAINSKVYWSAIYRRFAYNSIWFLYEICKL